MRSNDKMREHAVEKLKQAILRWAKGKVEAVGFAPVDRFHDAPEAHQPCRICKDARTVIVFGNAVPRGLLRSPDYSLYIFHRTYHSVYERLNKLGLRLSNWIEAQGNWLAVPVPSFAPLVYRTLEPWGILSLKHAAVKAGLGAFGKNGLVHNPEYGTFLRLGAVVTSVPLPGDPLLEQDPCPETCDACFRACPAQALDPHGPFKKMDCLAHVVKHAIYPLALKTEAGLRNIERVINTAGSNYWLTCNECLRVCPSNLKSDGRRKPPAVHHLGRNFPNNAPKQARRAIDPMCQGTVCQGSSAAHRK